MTEKYQDTPPPMAAIFAAILCVALFFCLSVTESLTKDPPEALDLGCPNPVCDCQECDCGDDCTCNTYVQPPPEEAGAKPPEKPVSNVLSKPKLAMHSIANCPPCLADKAKLGAWLSVGWDIEVFDDGFGESGKMYPWYEVTELDGRKYSFVGPLSPDKVERERRNATSASR
mgnify:CR=1 FL=1